jgi:hypothetical protein
MCGGQCSEEFWSFGVNIVVGNCTRSARVNALFYRLPTAGDHMHVKVLVANLLNKDSTKARQGFVVQGREQGSFYQKNGSTGRRRSKSKLNRPKRASAQSIRGKLRENNWTGSGLPIHPCARSCTL